MYIYHIPRFGVFLSFSLFGPQEGMGYGIGEGKGERKVEKKKRAVDDK